MLKQIRHRRLSFELVVFSLLLTSVIRRQFRLSFSSRCVVIWRESDETILIRLEKREGVHRKHTHSASKIIEYYVQFAIRKRILAIWSLSEQYENILYICRVLLFRIISILHVFTSSLQSFIHLLLVFSSLRLFAMQWRVLKIIGYKMFTTRMRIFVIFSVSYSFSTIFSSPS